MTELEGLPAPWPDVFELMWEAYAVGTIPVGAVIANDHGEVVSRGRNGIFEAPTDGQLAGSRLAHAEVNALLSLASSRTYEDLTLYSSLEPCHLCLSAAVSVRVGAVSYAARDPYGGAVGKLVPSPDHDAHPIRVQGPLDGIAGELPELLHLAHFLWRRPDGDVVRFYATERPELVAAARRLPPPDAGAKLDRALDALG